MFVCDLYRYLIIQTRANAQLPGTVLHITTVQATLFTFFSGTPFTLYLVYWVVISAFLWGLGVPEAITQAEMAMATGRHDATMAMLNWMYSGTWHFLSLSLSLTHTHSLSLSVSQSLSLSHTHSLSLSQSLSLSLFISISLPGRCRTD